MTVPLLWSTVRKSSRDALRPVCDFFVSFNFLLTRAWITVERTTVSRLTKRMEGRRRLSTRLSEALVVWSSLSLIAWAPFTKVEEVCTCHVCGNCMPLANAASTQSFNLHAVGDIVSLGFDPSALARASASSVHTHTHTERPADLSFIHCIV